MNLTGFRIQNYRSVNDSGWIPVDTLTALVGKNQAGKSAILRGLHKFNPFKEEPYNMDKEWPRGRRKDRNPRSPVPTVRFQLTGDERIAVSKLAGGEIPEFIVVTKSYEGSKVFSYEEKFDPDEKVVNDLRTKIADVMRLADGGSQKFSVSAGQYAKEHEDNGRLRLCSCSIRVTQGLRLPYDRLVT